jgi:hypothetical protein
MSAIGTSGSNTISFSIFEDKFMALEPLATDILPVEKILQRFINQMISRDGHKAAWTQVIKDDPDSESIFGAQKRYTVSITCADRHVDVSAYHQVILDWLSAVAQAFVAYNNILASINPLPPSPPDQNGVCFLPPFGLAISKAKAVQLLHYPPNETLEFWDYLYSPTNRRWETLLCYNGGFNGQEYLLESIVDIVPVCADGGKAGTEALRPWTEHQPGGTAFGDYIQVMLSLLLRNSITAKSTAPIVAFGSPVLHWLEEIYKPVDISPIVENRIEKLQALSLFKEAIVNEESSTPILCANHPAKFFYYKTDQKDAFKSILLQDLIAARWQIKMAQNPDFDPADTLKEAWEYWNSGKQAKNLELIFDDQVSEFVRE